MSDEMGGDKSSLCLISLLLLLLLLLLTAQPSQPHYQPTYKSIRGCKGSPAVRHDCPILDTLGRMVREEEGGGMGEESSVVVCVSVNATASERLVPWGLPAWSSSLLDRPDPDQPVSPGKVRCCCTGWAKEGGGCVP